jgi:hypothetical protein
MPLVCSQVHIKDRRLIQAVIVSIEKGGTHKVLDLYLLIKNHAVEVENKIIP